MPDWTSYKDAAKARGALALDLFMVHTVPVPGGPAVPDILPDHLAYQRQLESDGSLFLAGPLSDDTGTQIEGAGLVILRAQSLDHARALADADPMHSLGARSYTLRRWLVNEGSLTLSLGLSTATITLA
ncbi:YciI family protein [Tritonibacter horizontis]|uniref:YciI-like protein n=1 Tax=Tritonibacter horizontis TaxID=1768241 RepID=A0A132C250_9RHOB|nr:YciI family protein [Tritonibacter horizontis]KUP94586.1 YciI-like protein [Tritonibacter horizontis]